MRIRAIVLTAAVGAALAVPAAGVTHTVKKACHGSDRVLTTQKLESGAVIYNDDRGWLGDPDTAPVYDAIGRNQRLPALSRKGDASGFWLYLETNGHDGLQTGGDHAVLGESGEAAGFTDPCKATHTKTKKKRSPTWGYDSIVF